MILQLTNRQGEVLLDLISSAVSDLSYEIAATENPHYRLDLNARRDLLSEVQRDLHRIQADTLGATEKHPIERRIS